MRAVHCVRDIAGRKLRGHGLLSRERYSLVLLGEEEADLDAVAPGCVGIVVGENSSRFGLESSNGFFDKGLVRHIRVEDLSRIYRCDKFALPNRVSSLRFLRWVYNWEHSQKYQGSSTKDTRRQEHQGDWFALVPRKQSCKPA